MLSPLLWNLAVDSVLSDLTSKIIFVQGYEDDKVLMVQGKFTHFVAHVILFPGRDLGYTQLEVSCTVIYLGLTLDSKLTSNYHLNTCPA